MCVGCGICTTKCMFDAIRLERVCDYKGGSYNKTLLGVVGCVPQSIGRTVARKLKKRDA